VEVGLQQRFDITRLSLEVAQLPDGNTIHQIWVSNSPIHDDLSHATLAQTLSGFTKNHQILGFSLQDRISAEFVQVRTTSSPSWVAWPEVQVYANPSPAPEPSGLALAGVGVAGVVGYVWCRRRKPAVA
jgi:hypothetical protein